MLLNIDCGEYPDRMAEQDAMLAYVQMANIACGGHAGDAASIEATVEQCVRRGVQTGAHPSYPDRENFGRMEIAMDLEELAESIREQVLALAAFTTITHVKPHGALYNVAARNPEVAWAIAHGVERALGPAMARVVPMLGLARSPMLEIFRMAGFPVMAEGFADRAYEPDGSLRARALAGALITDPLEAKRQAQWIEQQGWAQTICVHSDTPDALRILQAIATTA